jgi:DNA-binding transcriptional LysR family regulator
MELRHLKYFVVVAEEENDTRAAARLHVSQPGLSRQIRDLEEELGVPLFYHRAKSLKLTEAGRLFMEEARSVLLRADVAAQAVRDFAGGRNGVIHVGFAPSLTTKILPGALRTFQETCPKVRVQLHDLSTEEMLAGLCEETLHAALADPDAAQELLDGRLTGALNRAGFGEPGAGAKGSPARKKPVRAAKRAAGRSASEAKAAEDERQAARRARIERDLGEAWSEARRTAEERDALDAEARAADKRRAEAAREVRRLREDLQRAEQSLVDAEQSESAAARARDRAEKEADRARQRVTDLQARLDEV